MMIFEAGETELMTSCRRIQICAFLSILFLAGCSALSREDPFHPEDPVRRPSIVLSKVGSILLAMEFAGWSFFVDEIQIFLKVSAADEESHDFVFDSATLLFPGGEGRHTLPVTYRCSVEGAPRLLLLCVSWPMEESPLLESIWSSEKYRYQKLSAGNLRLRIRARVDKMLEETVITLPAEFLQR